jgi:hypothetical protein
VNFLFSIFDRQKPFTETGELSLALPALPRPTLEEIQERDPSIDSIKRDTSPEHPVTLVLVTLLRPKELLVVNPEYNRRLARLRSSLLGYQHLRWLLEHQAELPSLVALLGKVHIDFPGIIVVHKSCSQVAPSCLPSTRGYWYGDLSLGSGFPGGRVAVARALQSKQ